MFETEKNLQIALLIVLTLNLVFSCRYCAVPFLKLATCREFVTDSKTCDHFIPIDSLKNYAETAGDLQVKLYVMSYNDGNFFLSKNKDLSDAYTVVVAGWGNTKSIIRYKESEIEVSTLKGIVDPQWATPIVMTLTKNKTLEVSIPGLAEPLLKKHGLDLIANYICFSGWGKTNRWFYNCSEEEDLYRINVRTVVN